MGAGIGAGMGAIADGAGGGGIGAPTDGEGGGGTGMPSAATGAIGATGLLSLSFGAPLCAELSPSGTGGGGGGGGGNSLLIGEK